LDIPQVEAGEVDDVLEAKEIEHNFLMPVMQELRSIFLKFNTFMKPDFL
jgi:hypothetical protein